MHFIQRTLGFDNTLIKRIHFVFTSIFSLQLMLLVLINCNYLFENRLIQNYEITFEKD